LAGISLMRLQTDSTEMRWIGHILDAQLLRFRHNRAAMVIGHFNIPPVPGTSSVGKPKFLVPASELPKKSTSELISEKREFALRLSSCSRKIGSPKVGPDCPQTGATPGSPPPPAQDPAAERSNSTRLGALDRTHGEQVHNRPETARVPSGLWGTPAPPVILPRRRSG
jgi:hypothetical protein